MSKELGQELGVQYVVEGSIRKFGSHCRLGVQLVDAETRNHLWAERYDRELQDVFTIEDEVTTAIVAAVAGQIQAAGIDKLRRKRPANLAAYDYLLRGLEHFNRAGSEDIIPARDMFAQAIEIDPDFAQAHASLALLLVEVFWTESLPDSKARLEQALLEAQKAVALDGNDSVCHMALALVHLARKSFDLAAHHIGLATKLNPNDAESIAHHGTLEMHTGRPEQALQSISFAMRLNPTPPNYYWIGQGLALYHLRRCEEASRAFERATAWRPYVYRYLAACFAQLDRLSEARALVAESLKLQPRFTLGVWAIIEPYQSREDLDDMLDGLRKAGLPE